MSRASTSSVVNRLRRLAASRRLRQLVAALVSLVTLALALRGVDLSAVVLILARLDWPLLVVAAGFEFLAWWFTATRWRRIFAPRPTPDLKRFFWALTVTQLANTILPGKIGILARILLIGESMGQTASLCSVALEKALEGLTLFVAFLVMVPFLGATGWLRPDDLAVTSVALLAISLVVIALVVGQRQTILHWAQRWQWSRALVGPIAAALDTLEVTRRPLALAELLGWSALIWVLTVLQNYALLLALGIAVPMVAVWMLTVALQVGVRVPALPASVGVFHYAAVLVLTLFGVSESAALSYAAVLHILIFLVPSLLAVGYLWRIGYDWRSWRWVEDADSLTGEG